MTFLLKLIVLVETNPLRESIRRNSLMNYVSAQKSISINSFKSIVVVIVVAEISGKIPGRTNIEGYKKGLEDYILVYILERLIYFGKLIKFFAFKRFY